MAFRANAAVFPVRKSGPLIVSVVCSERLFRDRRKRKSAGAAPPASGSGVPASPAQIPKEGAGHPAETIAESSHAAVPFFQFVQDRIEPDEVLQPSVTHA